MWATVLIRRHLKQTTFYLYNLVKLYFVLQDYRFPLMGEIQYHHAYCTCHMHSGNAVVGDMFMSCRPKVYCLLQILHKKQLETSSISNEFYKVFEEGKSVQDQVSL